MVSVRHTNRCEASVEPWYRCNTCNYAWRGFQAYWISVIANVWWPITRTYLSEKGSRLDVSDDPNPNPNRRRAMSR
ncbi:MAG TPA: hypothetical protein EYQ83_12995 [Acidobacteria bacterium]|nr:hypothetical protein [Acidobacteriota bacterium]